MNGVEVGYWGWFRKDGVRMRSGYFDAGQQTGEWTTYDKTGGIFRVTSMKPKAQKVSSGTAANERPRSSVHLAERLFRPRSYYNGRLS